MKETKLVKESIIELHSKAEIEKKALLDSIEMMWLNAEIQKKKNQPIKIPKGAESSITRIRELLACAWFEDSTK